VSLLLNSSLYESVLGTTGQFCYLIRQVHEVTFSHMSLIALEQRLKTDWLFRYLPLLVFLLLVNVLEFMYELWRCCLAESLLLLFTLDDHTLFLHLKVPLFVFMGLGLAVQELHEGDMVDDGVRIVNQDELLLTIIEHFVSAFARHMHDEEVRLLALPRSWVLRMILGLVHLNRLIALLKLFPPSSCASLCIVLLWIVLLDHRRTVMLPLHRLVTSFHITSNE
jgi:hypothetical protein